MADIEENIIESPLFLLVKAGTKWQRLQQQVLAEHKLTYTQFVVLAIVVQHSGQVALNQQQIADAAGLDKMVVSQTVKELEDDGSVTRRPSPEDGRAMLIHVTPKATALLQKVLEGIIDVEEELQSMLQHDLAYFEYALKSISG